MAATLRKYITVKPHAPVDDLGKAYRSMTIAHNRLGGTITNIGIQFQEFQQMLSVYQESMLDFKDREKKLIEEEHEARKSQIEATSDLLGRKKGLEQDKKAEEKQESLSESQAEKEGEIAGEKEKKSRFGWLKLFLKPLGTLLGALMKFAMIPIAIKFLDWLSDPENKEKISKILGFFAGLWKFSRTIAGFGIDLIMDGVTDVFGNDPDKNALETAFDKMFGILKVIGGLASLWAASRLLMPWKLIGDVRAMTLLGQQVSAAEKVGCKPDGGGKPRKGQRIGRDGRTSQQRLDDIKKAKRQRRLASLQRKLGDRWASSAAVSATGVDTVLDTSKKLSPFQLEQARKAATKAAVEGTADAVTPQTKGVFGQLGEFLGNKIQQGGNLVKSGVDATRSKLVQAKNFALDVGGAALGKINAWWQEGSKRLIEGAKGVGQGIWNWGKNTAKSIGDVAAMAKNPKKLGDVVLNKVKGFIKPVIEKNETAKKVTEFVSEPDKPKKAKNFIGNLLKSGFKNPGFKTFREFLVAAKNNAKIGGIDKLVASVLALLDYTVFGESPINAVLKALGGLLGYSAGFAIGAPFGGVPGFITGAAGGFAGEWAADRLLEVLAKTPLKDIDDPVAEMLGADEGGGFMGFGAKRRRKLVRDPNEPQPWEDDLLAAAQNDDASEKPVPAGLEKMSKGGVLKGLQKAKDIPKPTYNIPPALVNRLDIPTKGEGQFKRFATGGLHVFSTAPAGAPKMMGSGKGYKDTYPHHAPKAGGNVPRAGGIPRDYLISEKSNPSTPDSKGDRHPIRAGVTGTVDSVGEGWGAVRVKNETGPIFRSGHMTGIKVKIGDKVTPSTIIGTQDAVGMSNGYVHAHIEAKTPALHNAWMRANIGATSKDTGKDTGPAADTDSVEDMGTAGKAATDSGDGEGAGGPSISPTDEYLSTEKMVEFLKGKAGILGKYMNDANAMPSAFGGGTSSGVEPKTSLAPIPTSQTPPPDAGDANDGGGSLPLTQTEQAQSQLNNKVEKLEKLSANKTRQSKEPVTNTNMMVAVQPVIKTQTMKTGKKVINASGSISPMLFS